MQGAILAPASPYGPTDLRGPRIPSALSAGSWDHRKGAVEEPASGPHISSPASPWIHPEHSKLPLGPLEVAAPHMVGHKIPAAKLYCATTFGGQRRQSSHFYGHDRTGTVL